MGMLWRNVGPQNVKRVKASVALGSSKRETLTDEDHRRIAESVAAGLLSGIVSVALFVFVGLPLLGILVVAGPQVFVWILMPWLREHLANAGIELSEFALYAILAAACVVGYVWGKIERAHAAKRRRASA